MSTDTDKRVARIAGWTATLLSAAWFLVHTFVGGAEVAEPLRLSDLPDEVRAPASMVWNMVTGILPLLAVLFGWATLTNRPDAMLSATSIACVLAVAGILSAPLSGVGFGTLPQGFLFVPVAIAGFVAWRRLAPK